MSKVTAYICDYGNHLVTEDNVIGLVNFVDPFDRLMSFPPAKKAADVDIHVCGLCYKRAVLKPAQEMVDRRNNEEGYKAKIKELQYGFRAQAVKNHRDKNRNKESVTGKKKKF